MAKLPAPDPKIEVRERVEITIPVNEVAHIIRCWVDHTMAGIPKPQTFNEIAVKFEMIGSDDYSDLSAVTVTYTPKSRVDQQKARE